jgi:hypothetical protein
MFLSFYVQSCINVAISRNEALAGSIVRIILAYSMNLNSDLGHTQIKSSSLSATEIHNRLKNEAYEVFEEAQRSGQSANKPEVIDFNTLKRLLELLRLDSIAILLKVSISFSYSSFILFLFDEQVIGSEKNPGGPEYMVNMEGIISALKDKVMK